MSNKDNNDKPRGELTLRTQTMPKDTNPAGDIFGGWVLSQMDIAGGLVTKNVTKGRTVTVAVDSMTFHLPVLVGDTLCCYVEVIKIGKTSIQTRVEAWAQRQYDEGRIKVTEGTFTYVAVDAKRNKRIIDKS